MKSILLVVIFYMIVLSWPAEAGTTRINVNAYDKMVVPEVNGQLITIGTKIRTYPARDWFAQLVIFINTNAASMLMVRATDPDAQYFQDWEIVNNDTTAPCINTEWCLRITFHSPSDPSVEQATYGGSTDWRVPATDYKSWAQSQTWYHAHGKLLTGELAHIVLGATNAYSYYVSTLRATTTTAMNPKRVGVFMTQWRTDAFDVNYPNYVCSGTANCAAWFQDVNDTGYAFTLPYFNGILWDTTNGSYNAANMCLDSGGSPYVYSGNLRWVDPLLSSWPQTLYDAFVLVQATDNSTSKGIYLDVLGAMTKVCYYTGTPNYAAVITGEKAIYTKFTDQIIMSEGTGEVFFPYIDIVYQAPANTDNNDTEVGLFGYLYGDVPDLHIVGLGTESSPSPERCLQYILRGITEFYHTASLFSSGFTCDQTIQTYGTLANLVRSWVLPAGERTPRGDFVLDSHWYGIPNESGSLIQEE
jgi:hypothetical protein